VVPLVIHQTSWLESTGACGVRQTKLVQYNNAQEFECHALSLG